jgi:hypothetical protein
LELGLGGREREDSEVSEGRGGSVAILNNTLFRTSFFRLPRVVGGVYLEFEGYRKHFTHLLVKIARQSLKSAQKMHIFVKNRVPRKRKKHTFFKMCTFRPPRIFDFLDKNPFLPLDFWTKSQLLPPILKLIFYTTYKVHFGTVYVL